MCENHYAVIMAGGKGERFWPLSTARRPKQFMSLIGGRSLLAQAVERLRGLIPPERVLVITGARLVEATHEAVPEIPRENVIGEPFGRDTAAACALASALVKARNPTGVFCILTADQIIGDLDAFRSTLRESLQMAASEDLLLTIGIQPAFASTGFGYIEAGQALAERCGIGFLKVKRFVEKPDRAKAEQFLAEGRYYWNSGMFIWSVLAFRKALGRHQPHLLEMADRMTACAGGPDFEARLREEYGRLQKISIDYAIMEKVDNIVMAKGVFAWDDVGSWSALENHLPSDAAGNVVVGACEAIDARGNVVVSPGRLTALIGVEDLVVVHSGTATLICPKSRAQEVRKMVQRLAEGGAHGEVL